ncbi:MAG: hydrogenase maturation nickel metallochaperone HypA [Phycisphaerales bacterium]|nr:hydrogenase maturation nickel metallochaperone HypA [Phycisphaerales bacterium]
MHDFSLMANLLEKIERLAQEQDAARVVGVNIRLGAMSHISSGHFREHFVNGTKGTKADGARLEIEVSEDTQDPNAQNILLKSIEVG